jgi:DNA-binding response OmpR family regulator
MSQTDNQVVLLIEDHRDTREMYAEMLHHAGFAVIEVSTAERALRLLSAVLPT